MRLSKNPIYILFILLTIFIVLSFYEYGSFKLVDDTYIYLQYARNIIYHHQVAFNLDEKSYAFTSPLWLTLIVIGSLVSGTSLYIPEILSVLFSSGTIVVWWYLLKKYDLSNQSITFLILFILLDPNLLKHSHIGMEAALSYFLSSLLLYICFFTKNKWKPQIIGAIVGLFYLVRPESLLLSAFIIIWLYKERAIIKKDILKILLFALLINLPWIIFSLLYFHRFFPSTFGAKGASYPLGLKFSQHSISELKILLGNYIVQIIFIVYFSVKYKDIRYTTSWTFAIIFSYCLFYSLSLSNELVYARYFCIIFPILNFNFISAAKKINFKRKFTFILVSTLLVLLFLQSIIFSSINNRYFYNGEHLETEIINWVNSNTNPHSLIVRGRIGEIAYQTNRRILDPVGLINPEITQYYLNKRIVDFYIKEKPDYFIGDSYDNIIKELKPEAKITLMAEFKNGGGLLRNYLSNQNDLENNDYQKIYHLVWLKDNYNK